MLRYRRKRRSGLYAAAALFLLLAAMPFAVGGVRNGLSSFDPLGFVGVYANGLDALGAIAWTALPMAGLFVLWLFTGRKRDVNRVWLNSSARTRRHLVEGLRIVLVTSGAAAMISGVLALLQIILLQVQPGLAERFGFSIPLWIAALCVVLGLAAYAGGRLGRHEH
jgi:hypothetical protein